MAPLRASLGLFDEVVPRPDFDEQQMRYAILKADGNVLNLNQLQR